jgi:hypothetical protein
LKLWLLCLCFFVFVGLSFVVRCEVWGVRCEVWGGWLFVARDFPERAGFIPFLFLTSCYPSRLF